MNILAPINDAAQLKPLIDAGADEFYFGFFEDSDTEVFGEYFELNRMSGFGRYANRFTLSEAVSLVRQIAALGKDSYVTLNSSGYTEQAIQRIQSYVIELVDAGVTGCIVSCPELLNVVRHCGGKAVISCVGTVYNEADVRFYQRLGATRVILPRDLSMDEITLLTTHVPDMEYETFLMRNGCILSDGNCLGLHRFEHGGICKDIRKSEKQFITKSDKDLDALRFTQELYDNCLFRNACAACALFRMLSIGITACKMVGRVDRPEQVLNDMHFVRKNREIAMSCLTEEEYFEQMILPDGYEQICNCGYSCYFPEIVNKRARFFGC